MTRAWLAAGLVATALAACVAPSPRPASSGAAPDVPAAVVTVRTLGDWETGEASGAYRLIVTEDGFDPLVSRLYLQWLAESTADAPARIVAARDFAELNALPGAALTIEAADAGVDGLVVRISAIAAAEPAPRRYRLTATTPGEARLEGPL